MDSACYNVADMVGDSLCITQPGTPFVKSNVTLGPSTPTTSAPRPSDVEECTTTYCGEYYLVQPGDTCNALALRNGISVADFVFLNPSINANCTNLLAEVAYCVEPVGDSKLATSLTI